MCYLLLIKSTSLTNFLQFKDFPSANCFSYDIHTSMELQHTCFHCIVCIHVFNQDPDAVDCKGNVLLNRCVGSKIVLVPPLKYDGSMTDGKLTKGLKHVMEDYSKNLQ